jgi:hypothetical protein
LDETQQSPQQNEENTEKSPEHEEHTQIEEDYSGFEKQPEEKNVEKNSKVKADAVSIIFSNTHHSTENKRENLRQFCAQITSSLGV